MPSGAKKRKAAKKKKEQEANINASTNNTNKSNNNNNNSNTPLGNDDPKSKDERESDGGDAGELASQDHHNQQHLLNEGNKESDNREVSRDVKSDNREVSQDVKDTANEGAEGNGTAKIQREMKSKDDLGGQNISIKHVEYVKESDDGSSSTSSSDNESQAVEKPSEKVIQGTEEKASSVKVADDLVVENVPAVVASDLVESRLKENEELKRNEDEVIPLSEESVEASWTVVEPVTNENEDKNLPLPAAPESSNGAKYTGDSKNTESSERKPLLASAPRVEQRTFCMSCCGLFDVLTGSSR